MIYFRPGSHVYRLITILSVVGEVPTSGLHLLGKERVIKALVHELTMKQTICNVKTDEKLTCTLLSISGSGKSKTVRIHKSGLPILTWLHPDALASYMASFRNHHFSGGDSHRDRNHRIAEGAMMCMSAGMEVRPYILPPLQDERFVRIVCDRPMFYLSRAVKQVGDDDIDKLAYSRMIRGIFTGDNCYAVYNTRNAVMKWNWRSEFKAKIDLEGIGSMNAGIHDLLSALMIGKSYDVLLKMLEAEEKDRRKHRRSDDTYWYVHFIPQTEFGIRLLRLLTITNRKERMLYALFEDSTRSYDRGRFEYDAYCDGVYVFSFLDGDITRLIRFKAAAADGIHGAKSVVVLGYPEQVRFLRAYLPESVEIRVIKMEVMEEALGITD